jgi:hypothetical protein
MCSSSLSTLELQNSEFQIILNSDVLTKVRRDVFPDPLGPIKRIDGRVAKSPPRKMNRCKNNGIVSTRRAPISRPKEDGLRRVCASSANPDMVTTLLRHEASGIKEVFCDSNLTTSTIPGDWVGRAWRARAYGVMSVRLARLQG